MNRPGTCSTAAALFLILPFATAVVFTGDTTAVAPQSGNSPPVVRLTRPADTQVLRWGSPFRYAMTVSDREDGESVSGEIPPHKILLEVEYRGPADTGERSRPAVGPDGLDVLRTSACFSCHADKTSLVGPSFSAIAARYGKDPEVQRTELGADALRGLSGRIRSGSSGRWGTLAMPPQGHLSEDEALAAARFIVEQGSRSDRWVYAGAEGVIRTVDKPAGTATGTYRLTASYLDDGIGGTRDTRRRGEHSVTFVIK